jgi:hypothetical protein
LESLSKGGIANVNSEGGKESSHIPVVPTNNPFLPAPSVPSTSNTPPSAATNPFIHHHQPPDHQTLMSDDIDTTFATRASQPAAMMMNSFS